MPELVVDPICGMRIDPADAVATGERGGVTSYFCSTACRDAFIREPGVAGGIATPDVPLTSSELADRAGVPGDWIDRLAAVGLLEAQEGRFSRRDVMQARVARDLEAIGFEPEALARARATGDLRLGYLESAGRRQPRSDRSYVDVAAELGVSAEDLQRIVVAFGLPMPEPDERVRLEDLEVLRVLGALINAGVDVAGVMRLARVWGDAVRRVAQYLPYYFHTSIEAPYRRRGLRDNEAYEAAIRDVGLRLGQSGEDILGWLFRRHSDIFLSQHQFEHVETALDASGVRRRPPRAMEAAVFADLSGFTRLTEESGDAAAAEVALRLAELAAEVGARHDGTTVKLLGDGALLHFRDPANAVLASLELVGSTRKRDLPPAHVGVNAGPMLYDQGDYFGSTVNLASRIGAIAGPGQVLVGASIAALGPQRGFQLVPAGTHTVKGLTAPIEVFEAKGAGAA